MRFDAKAAKLLQPGCHIVVDGFAGLRLVASSSGRSWIYRYQTGDKTRQIKMGEWPAMSLPSAVTKWQELKDARANGVDPALEKKAARKARAVAYTVSDAVADYIAGHLRVSRQAAGADAVAARLTRAIEPIATLPASEVTRRIAFDLIDGLTMTPVVAKSVRNELGAAWDLALDSGRLGEDSPNWWRQILAGKLKSKGAVRDGEYKGTAKRVLTDSELVTLLTVDYPLLAQTVQDVLTLYLTTGLRGGEIVQIHARQITQEGDGWWWTMPKALTKNAGRDNAGDLRVPLVGRALEVVQRRAGDGYLFAAKTKTGYTSQPGIQSQVNFRQPYCVQRPDVTRTRLAVTHWSPHDLRRTVRTGLAAMGCPSDVAESILGHVQPGIQGVYNAHKYDSERRHWLQLWSDRLELLISPAIGHGHIP